MRKWVASASDDGRPGLVFDAGALLAIKKGRLTDVLSEADRHSLTVRIPAGALAQAWRGGPRGARLASLIKLRLVTVVPLDLLEARRVGELVAHARFSPRARPDVVDAHAALLARETRSLVYTSDPEDLVRYGVPGALIVEL